MSAGRAPPAALAFADLFVGQEASFEARVGEADLDRFSALSGDFNPLHNDAGFAARRGFDGRVVHGAYLVGLVSRLVGMFLPGQNGLMLGLEVAFRRPVLPGTPLRLTGTVRELSEAVQAAVVALRLGRLDTGERLMSGKVTIGFTKEEPHD